MRQELSSHPLQDIVHFVRSQAIATFQDACKLRRAFTVALSAVFGYIGPFWQIIDPWRARGPSSAFLYDAHLSQDVRPGVALQGYRYFWRGSHLLSIMDYYDLSRFNL